MSDDQAKPQANGSEMEDFVSFPNLPDPEDDKSQTLTKLFTKTLKRVTNNASHIVQSYSSPKSQQQSHDYRDSIDNSPITTSVLANSKINNSKDHKLQEKSRRLQSALESIPSKSESQVSVNHSDVEVTAIDREEDSKSLQPPLVVSAANMANTNMANSSKDHLPMVTSDSKTLRFSSNIAPVLQPSIISSSAGNSMLNLNSLVNESIKENSSSEVSLSSKADNSKNKTNPKLTSIFNNLPNDIELSDDSASDAETVHETDKSPSIKGKHPPPDLSMYSESVVKSSPIKAQQLRNESSPTLSSYNALRQYNDGMKKKPSSNLSSSLIGNAKSIINTNFSGTMSSASSIIGSTKRKKPKARKTSENPLKSGGIPRKYWMNDSFVSECINCFKPFTAFRRKHHCRFCGQIFCSDCTLFVSYTQHKEERKAGFSTSSERKHYNDKLRVCKPCYSDVIVYLSDSDSSSSDSEIEDNAVSFETVEHVKPDDLPQHPFYRVRSQSTHSRRDIVVQPSSSSTLSLSVSDTGSKGFSLTTDRFDPQGLSIPTTRNGETVEVPISKNIHTNSNFLNPNSSPYNFSKLPTDFGSTNSLNSATWLKKYPSLRKSGNSLNSMVRSNSFDNLSNIHRFIGATKLSRIRSHTDTEGLRRIISGKFEDHQLPEPIDQNSDKDDDDEDDDDEFESENEDEKVMSLYTSLNHQATISPRAPIARPLATVSASAVPTLGEFPTMMVNEKLYPKNATSRTLFPRFVPNNGRSDEHLIESTSPFSRNLLEDNPKSSIRSHERAHASLLRMRSKKGRRGKGLRNVSLLSQNNAKLPYLEFVETRDANSISPPTSPSYANGAGSSNSFFKGNSNDDNDKSYNELESPLSEVMAKHRASYASFDTTTESPEKLPIFDVELDQDEKLDTIYSDMLMKILNQCLEDCDIKENAERWSNVLSRAVQAINRIHITDTLDIKQYVKIKKIPGGSIEKTSIEEGVIMTKNIDSKRMASTVDNPKIALLMFPIEYLKQKEQFISLRIVQSQQSVYITNLVSRLISLEPDIIVVGDTVCQLAESLLEEANITVISNTKPQVIERISRYTKGDIFQSVNDLFFKKGSLGTCKRFEVKKYLYGNVLKTFSWFTGTDAQLGFTIVLRGDDEETLNSIKYTTENVMLTQVNAKLEKSYFEDHSLCYIGDSPYEPVNDVVNTISTIKEEQKLEVKVPCELMPDEKEVLEYVDLFLTRVISSSPSSKFSLPGPLDNVLQAFIEYYNHNKVHHFLQTCESLESIEPQLIEDLRLDLDINTLPNTSQDLLYFLKFVSGNKLRTLGNTFQIRSRNWVNYMKLPCYQLYPIFHKNIHLLYSNISLKNNTPCSGPNIIVVDYYTDNDKCLGLQLDQMFSDSYNECEECGDLMLNHYRNYVHGNSKIDMIVEKYEALPPEHSSFANQRTLWSVCKECNYESPVVPMSNDTYYMSVGKYFEISFWGKNVVPDSKCDCKHDFFKNHIRYFGFNDMAIKVTHSPIDSFEVIVPRKQLEYDPAIDITLKVESFDSIRIKSAKFFQSVSKRLNRIKVDTFDKQEEDGSKRIEELKFKLNQQEARIKQETFEIFKSTLPTNYLSLNSILTQLQELGVLWDEDFNDFENDYLPSENEITRITQFHLRNFLLDRYNNEEKDTDIEPPKPDSPIKETLTEENLTEDRREEIGKLIPRALMSTNSNVSSKVHQMEALLHDENEEKKKITLNHKPSDISVYSNSSNKDKPQNKVSQLTSYFDQMNFDQISREFRAQRELELSKAKLNNAKTKRQVFPIVESKPIVEIYNKIEDVVGVNDELEKVKRVGTGSSLAKKDDLDKVKRTGSSLAKNDDDDDDEKKKEKEKPRKDKKPDRLIDIPQPERISLLKSLTNFWADRSASLWDPLEYPLDSTEHTFADSNIIVREDEPSSLVAFCLSTGDYKQKIKSMAEDVDNDTKLDPNEVNSKKISSFAKIEKKFKSDDNSTKPNDIERIMTKNKSTHLKYQFTDGNTELSCKIFYSEQFEALRRSCGKEDKFIQSLSRCVKWNSSGGKSGSNFLKTLDNRFIVKELSKSELESFVSMAPFYFKYISQSMFNTLTTALAKIFGFYQIHIKNNITGKTFRMDFLIMENLFYNIKTTRIFDLKGSMRNRHVTQTGKEDEVLLDENMIEYIYESPVFVKENSKKLLRGSLFNDTSFLSAMDVMDYSLIIGINDSSHKLCIGIIDWLRTFTWDKKVENWVKGNNLIGGNKKGKDPTIVTPKQYRIRFREAMERYILEVPDIWYDGNNRQAS